MKYISSSRIETSLPDNWNNLVKDAKKYLKVKIKNELVALKIKGSSKDNIKNELLKTRKNAINYKRTVWKTFSNNVKNISHEKCWYCDTKQDRSDMPIDHFRPKANVTEDKKHNGYWWLAFEWQNLRYSCTYCNRVTEEGKTKGGKSDHFPLLTSKKRAFFITDNIGIETPLILDPLVLKDTILIAYNDNGRVMFSAACNSNNKRKKVKTTIKILHLNSSRLVKARKSISIMVKKLVEELEEHYNNDDLEKFETTAEHLDLYINDERPYSFIAKQYLKNLLNTKNKLWLNNFI